MRGGANKICRRAKHNKKGYFQAQNYIKCVLVLKFKANFGYVVNLVESPRARLLLFPHALLVMPASALAAALWLGLTTVTTEGCEMRDLS